jgi:polyisoprenyl-teichoic acid--peptidoglycan teichoic acid transferase
MYRPIALAVVLSIVVVSCSGGDAATTTTAAPPTTTTTTVATTSSTAQETTTTVAETTTTTTPVVEITGLTGPGLTAVIEQFYGLARGDTETAPAAPAPMLPEPGSLEPGTTVAVELSTARYGDGSVAVWRAGKDIVGAVQDGSGWRIVAGHAPSVGGGPYYGGMPMHVAVVGSDARKGQDVEASRADSIHIVGLDGKGGAGMVGIPRDSWVSIDGGGHNKINSSLANGGPEAMMNTFEDLSSLDLDGYVLTGFEGFEEMVDQVLEPFQMKVPFTFSDRSAKADFEEGDQVVDGDAALAFSRARKAFTTGDFQRQLNGGIMLLAGAIGAKVRGPLAVPEMISGTQEWMFTDLTSEQLVQMSLYVMALNPTKVGNTVLKGGTGTSSGGASIVRLNAEAAAATFEDLADGRIDD